MNTFPAFMQFVERVNIAFGYVRDFLNTPIRSVIESITSRDLLMRSMLTPINIFLELFPSLGSSSLVGWLFSGTTVTVILLVGIVRWLTDII